MNSWFLARHPLLWAVRAQYIVPVSVACGVVLCIMTATASPTTQRQMYAIAAIIVGLAIVLALLVWRNRTRPHVEPALRPVTRRSAALSLALGVLLQPAWGIVAGEFIRARVTSETVGREVFLRDLGVLRRHIPSFFDDVVQDSVLATVTPHPSVAKDKLPTEELRRIAKAYGDADGIPGITTWSRMVDLRDYYGIPPRHSTGAVAERWILLMAPANLFLYGSILGGVPLGLERASVVVLAIAGAILGAASENHHVLGGVVGYALAAAAAVAILVLTATTRMIATGSRAFNTRLVMYNAVVMLTPYVPVLIISSTGYKPASWVPVLLTVGTYVLCAPAYGRLYLAVVGAPRRDTVANRIVALLQ
jgi:hypothetical protein